MWDWHDYWRVLNLLVCAPCFFVLLLRYKQNRWSWNVKTTDYWFALAVWTFTGAAASIEGIVMNSPPGFRLVLILAGGLVTLKALLRAGAWGENNAGDTDSIVPNS